MQKQYSGSSATAAKDNDGMPEISSTCKCRACQIRLSIESSRKQIQPRSSTVVSCGQYCASALIPTSDIYVQYERVTTSSRGHCLAIVRSPLSSSPKHRWAVSVCISGRLDRVVSASFLTFE